MGHIIPRVILRAKKESAVRVRAGERTMEAEVRDRQPQAKAGRQPPKDGKGEETESPQSLQKELALKIPGL